MSAGPLLSIVTPTLNRARYLGEAIESVLAQRFADFEHLIIDGGSTDETPALLAGHPHLRVVREPDRGLYDAINKGLRLARGEIVALLNSDDLFAPNAFAAAASAFADPSLDLATGGAELFTDDGTVVRRITTPPELELCLGNVLAGTPVINARFFRRSFLARLGEFDLSFPIAADRDFLIRAALAQPRERMLPSIVYRYRQHAGSLTVHDTAQNVAGYREEHVALAEKHLAAPRLGASNRLALRAFHARESASVAVLCLTQGRARELSRWASRGCRQSLAWPLRFALRLAGHALGR